MQTGRYTVNQHLFYQLPVAAQFLFRKPKNRKDLPCINQTSDPGQQLCQNRCKCRPCYSHRNPDHKGDIQNHIQHTRNNQEYQRYHRIPQRTQNRRDPVIQHRSHCSGKYNHQIYRCLVKQIIRGLQGPQKRSCPDQSRNCNDQRRYNRHIDRRNKGFCHFFLIPATIILRNHHAYSCRQAHHNRKQQIHGSTCDTDRSKCLISEISSYYINIYKIIDSLKQHPKKHRQRKPNHLRQDAPFRHINCLFPHTGTLLFAHLYQV